MKILLLKPPWFLKKGVYSILNRIKFTPLNLGIIASLSPGHDITVIDGDWDEIPYGQYFDLVGITVATFTSQTAYEIADRFRKTGSKIIFGGPHASLLPGECLEYADSVVVGEAENVWQEVLQDAMDNSLKRIYRGTVADMYNVPCPRRDLLREQSWFACVQATRGCPNTCAYCYLPQVPWSAYRKRDIDSVYNEIKNLRQSIIFFVDDNLFADEDYAIKLFERLAPLKKKWSIQAPTNIARNSRLLDIMAESGCFYVQMGFQTVNPGSLEWASIKQNKVEEYREIVGKLHARNISVTGFFIFGFDTDSPALFEHTLKAITKMRVDYAHIYILTLYPGTPIYDRFSREGRLLKDKDRSHYGWANAMFMPKQMSPEELEKGVCRLNRRLYRHFARRLPRLLLRHCPVLLKNPRMMLSLVNGMLSH